MWWHLVFRLSDASGRMSFDLVAEGDISKDMLDSDVSKSYVESYYIQK